MSPSPFPQEGQWIARPQKPRWGLRWAAVGGLAWQLPNLLNVLRNVNRSHTSFWPKAIVDGLLIAFTVVLIGTALRDLLARRKRLADIAFEEKAFGDQFPVVLTLSVSGRPLGTDRGIVWFADGLMGFSGSACSFVLAASNLTPRRLGGRRKPTAGPIPRNAVALYGAPKFAYFQVAPLFGHGKTYRERFERFIRANETPEGEQFWPPLEPYEETAALAISQTEPL